MLLPCLLALALAAPTAGAILEDVPEKPDLSARYLIYVHGRIMETKGRQAVSPDFGLYDYDGILGALAARGFLVIAEVRKGDQPEFPVRVAKQVRKLLAAGVPAAQITVLGFSRGGGITVDAAAELGEPDVSFVVLAGCSAHPEWSALRAPRVRGRMLSLLDQKDRFDPSCQPLFAAASKLSEAREVTFHTGLDHGLFYRPRPDWLDRVQAWAARRPLP